MSPQSPKKPDPIHFPRSAPGGHNRHWNMHRRLAARYRQTRPAAVPAPGHLSSQPPLPPNFRQAPGRIRDAEAGRSSRWPPKLPAREGDGRHSDRQAKDLAGPKLRQPPQSPALPGWRRRSNHLTSPAGRKANNHRHESRFHRGRQRMQVKTARRFPTWHQKFR